MVVEEEEGCVVEPRSLRSCLLITDEKPLFYSMVNGEYLFLLVPVPSEDAI